MNLSSTKLDKLRTTSRPFGRSEQMLVNSPNGDAVRLVSLSPLLFCALFVAAGDANAASRANDERRALALSNVTAQDTTQESPATVSGNWQMSWTDQKGDPMQALFQVQQNGSKLSGNFEAKRGSFPLTVRVRGNQVSMTVKARRWQASFTGTVDGDKMSGTTEQGKSWTATRQ
jgi:hypothetical protein